MAQCKGQDVHPRRTSRKRRRLSLKHRGTLMHLVRGQGTLLRSRTILRRPMQNIVNVSGGVHSAYMRTLRPSLDAYWIARCPRPPIPCTKQRSPGFHGAVRIASNTVMPPQSKGASSAYDAFCNASSGMLTTAITFLQSATSHSLSLEAAHPSQAHTCTPHVRRRT